MALINHIFTSEIPSRHRFSKLTLDKIILSWFFRGALLLLLTPTTLVLAQDKEQLAVLTLAEAVERTFANNPDLQSYQYKLQAQQGKIIQADLSPKPQVELTIEDALGSGDFSGVDSAQTTLSVSWILDQSIKNERVNIASQNKKLIENEQTIQRLDSAAQTAKYFLTALSFQQQILIARRGITFAETTVAEVKKRVKVGKTPLAELYRAEAELAKRELLLVDKNHELESSIRRLAAQWGSTSPNFNAVSGSLSNQPQVVSFPVLKNRLLNNPHIAKYLSLERVKQAELKLAQEERNRQWKFTTGVKHYQRSNDYGLVASFSIPFGGNNNNQGRISEVKAKLSQNQSEAEALKIRIETSLFIVYQQLEHSFHLSENLALEIIPRLEKALKETYKAYELGKYSYLEWLAVQNELLDAQSALLEANLSAHFNRLELERLTGTQITSPF